MRKWMYHGDRCRRPDSFIVENKMMLFLKGPEHIFDSAERQAGESCQLFHAGRVAVFQIEFKDMEANFAALLFHPEHLSIGNIAKKLL